MSVSVCQKIEREFQGMAKVAIMTMLRVVDWTTTIYSRFPRTRAVRATFEVPSSFARWRALRENVYSILHCCYTQDETHDSRLNTVFTLNRKIQYTAKQLST